MTTMLDRTHIKTLTGRWLAGLAVALSAVAFALPTATEASTPTPVTEQQTHKLVAEVKIEIRQESGKVVKNVAEVEWNQAAEVVFEAEDHKHDVDLQLQRANGKSKNVNVTMAYERDGKAIIAPYEFDARVKKREVIRIEGGLAIAVTVTPKRKKIEAPKQEPPAVDPGEGDDPLSGLE